MYQVFQTKINALKLCDRSKPGHLKLFVFHLVDPNRRIMSTSRVPCQRRDWWAREIRQLVPVLRRLPMEIFDRIIDVGYYISLKMCACLLPSLQLSQMVDDFPISVDEAEKSRSDFLQERAELSVIFY